MESRHHRRAGDARSASLIDFISGRTATNRTPVRHLHPDFGPSPYGIPYVVVAGDQPRVTLALGAYGDESDTGAPGLPGYPIPDEARTAPNYIEGRSLAVASRAIGTCS